MERNDISRRNLLQYGVAVGTVCACGGCIPGGSKKADVVADPKDGVLRLDKAQSAQLTQPGSSLLVRPKGHKGKILLIDADNSLYAVSAKCTHMGCDVAYDPQIGHIVCPCHGSEYALDGSNLKGPAKRPLRKYDVHRQDGQIVVTL